MEKGYLDNLMINTFSPFHLFLRLGLIHRASFANKTFYSVAFMVGFVFLAGKVSAQTTYYLTSGQTNPQASPVADYYDLSTTSNNSSDGLLGQPLNTQILVPAEPSQASSPVTWNLLYSPDMSTAPTDNPPGATPTGYGFETSSTLACDIAAGTWHFSNQFALNPAVCSSCTFTFEPKVAVYVYNGSTATQLFTAAGNAFTASGSESTSTVSVWSKAEPAFTGIAGDYLVIEYYLKLIATLTGATDGWSSWYGDLGFNTTQDFVIVPACNPTNTPTVTPTPTPDGCASWVLAGNAVQGTAVTLTTATTNQIGAAWSSTCINIAQSFNMTFKAYFGAAAGADGIDFVLQNDPRGTSALGGVGGNKGYAGTGVAITPSVAFDLETYENNGYLGMEENGTGTYSCTYATTTCPFTFPSSVSNGVEHSYNVIWDAVGKNLSLVFDGTTVMIYNRDLVNLVFGGTTCVYYGFTAATGSASTNLQYVYGVNCFTSTPTATKTTTNTATNTGTQTATNTATASATNTATQSSTNTATNTVTPSTTNTVTNTATASATNSPTETSTSSPTASSTNTATNTATSSTTNTATNTATASATHTVTHTSTFSPTNTITNTATVTMTSTPTYTPTVTPTITVTRTPTLTPTVTITPTPASSPNLPGPNPFTPNLPTNNFVSFNLSPGHSSGELFIFDLKRYPVRRIDFAAGTVVSWDGKNDGGQVVQGGLYVYLLSVDGHVHRGSITVLK